MADIFETCDLINQYIEESKGNALDKLYGKDIKKYTDTKKIGVAALLNGMNDEYVAKKRREATYAFKDITDKHGYGDSMTRSLVSRSGFKEKNSRLNPSRSEIIDDIRELKQKHGIGKDFTPESRKGGAYLNMQKVKDDVNARKRSDSDKIPDSVKNSHPDKSKMRAFKVKSTTAAERMNESTDARLNVYEAFEAGLITEFEKTELLNILNTYEE